MAKRDATALLRGAYGLHDCLSREQADLVISLALGKSRAALEARAPSDLHTTGPGDAQLLALAAWLEGLAAGNPAALACCSGRHFESSHFMSPGRAQHEGAAWTGLRSSRVVRPPRNPLPIPPPNP